MAEASRPAEGLPIAVLTGFLGSGKTTFLRRALASPGMGDTAVIINEFGDVGLDHLLLEAAPDEVVRLPSGCLCCAVRQDLVRTLYRLLARRSDGDLPPFRRIVIETSGLAEPAPILYTLAADAHLEKALRFAAVLTLVDAVAGLATLDRYAEATAQAAVADRLLLSKTDLAAPPPALIERLAALNPNAEMTDAADPAHALFGPVTQARSHSRLFAAAATHTHGIGSFAIALRREMSRLDFARALGGLARDRGDDLLRVKGIVAFADRPDRPAAIHAVQHTLYPPDWLDAWPDAERLGRLVFITRAITCEDVLARFAHGDPIRRQ
ncbi:MAG: GTP-binding protein [Acetobacteraceae bacterium]